MESSLIASIVTALAPEASEEKRAAGALACLTIHAALAGHGAAPVLVPAPAAAPAPPIPETPVAAIVSRLRGMPLEQVFDLAINRLQVAVTAREQTSPAPPSSPTPASVPAPPVGPETTQRLPPMRFQMVPVPPVPGAKRAR